MGSEERAAKPHPTSPSRPSGDDYCQSRCGRLGRQTFTDQFHTAVVVEHILPTCEKQRSFVLCMSSEVSDQGTYGRLFAFHFSYWTLCAWFHRWTTFLRCCGLAASHSANASVC